MKIPSFLRTSMLSALVFFGTLGALSIGYATWVGMTGNYSAGENFTATLWNNLVENVNDLDARLSLKADIESPAFSGTPTAPTQNNGTSDTSLATTAFVETRVASAAGSQYFGCYVSTIWSNNNSTYASCIAGYTKVYSANVHKQSIGAITFESGYPPSANALYALGGTVSLLLQLNANNYTTVILNGTDIYPLANGISTGTSTAYNWVALCCK